MNGPVDVLAVLDRLDGDMCLPDLGEIAAVRAAVAELIDTLAEIVNYNSEDHNDTSLVDDDLLWARAEALLAHVRGDA